MEEGEEKEEVAVRQIVVYCQAGLLGTHQEGEIEGVKPGRGDVGEVRRKEWDEGRRRGREYGRGRIMEDRGRRAPNRGIYISACPDIYPVVTESLAAESRRRGLFARAESGFIRV